MSHALRPALRACLTFLVSLVPAAAARAHGGPVLFVRFVAEPGVQATFARAPGVEQNYPVPVTVGLRPGYVYRLRLAGYPYEPGDPEALYPTVQVFGALHLPPALNPADFPVPVVISRADYERAAAGAFVTKVIYLECPELADPVATEPDKPLEREIRPDLDPVLEARRHGRPLLVVRFGERQAGPAELVPVSGTVLLPGEAALPPPAGPPCLPWTLVRPYDPVAGPRPKTEEVLHDGGDVGLKAGLDRAGRLLGLDPTDTVAEFTDGCGRKSLTVSNRICLVVPRYSVLRQEVLPAGTSNLLAVELRHGVTGREVLQGRLPPLVAEQIERPEGMTSPQRPSESQVLLGLTALDLVAGPTVVIGQQGGKTVIGTCAPKPHAPVKPLVLCKKADRPAARIGEVVTFTLQYANPGGQPITDVAVSDSLTGRLEYVPGSAKSDRPAVFTTQANEAGSAVLRWELDGTLPPGQTGTLTFQARVR